MDKEELVFNLKKDTAYKSSRDFKEDIIRNLKIKDIDFRNVYVRIINYQIRKYGEPLFTKIEVESWKGLGKQKSILSCQRRKKMRNYDRKRYY